MYFSFGRRVYFYKRHPLVSRYPRFLPKILETTPSMMTKFSVQFHMRFVSTGISSIEGKNISVPFERGNR